MIIKSISHSSRRANIHNLITYVFSDKNLMNRAGESVTISSFLAGKRNTWGRQFERNEQRRKSFYGGREVRLFHEILSYHPESQPSASEIESLMWKYIQERTGNRPVLAFGSCHFSESHYHSHIVFAGIDCYGSSLRLSRSEFRAVQIRMNEYMLEHFPHLKESYVDYGKASKEPHKRHSHKSDQRAKRTHQKPKKERTHDLIQTAFVDSSSIEAFVANLALKNIEVYYRREKLTGIIFEDQKMRLKRALGIDFEKLLKPELREERLKRIRNIKDSRNIDKTKER